MPITLDLCCIIEGHGEDQAVPVLARRIQQELRSDIRLEIKRLRVPRHKIVKEQELERAVEFASRLTKPPRAILILVDADDDPPCVLGPKLLQRAKAARSDVPVGVVLANREFESWFLASIESLSGRRGLAANLPPISNVEGISDAKGKLRELMLGSQAYSEVLDQPAFAATFDMTLARQRSDSFDKCWREIARLLVESVGAVGAEASEPT